MREEQAYNWSPAGILSIACCKTGSTLVYTLFVSFGLTLLGFTRIVVTPIYSEVDNARVLEIVDRFESEIPKQFNNIVNYHRSQCRFL